MDIDTSPDLSLLDEPAVVPWPEKFEHISHSYAPLHKDVFYYVEDPILYLLHTWFNKFKCKLKTCFNITLSAPRSRKKAVSNNI